VAGRVGLGTGVSGSGKRVEIENEVEDDVKSGLEVVVRWLGVTLEVPTHCDGAPVGKGAQNQPPWQ